MFQSIQSNKEIALLVDLATEIWHEHYTAIIGKEQVEYMLQHFHSAEKIAQQISHQNYFYYLIQVDEQPVGYIGVQVKDGELFLSKIYLLASQRGKGLAKQAMAFIKEFAIEQGLAKISLTVNKYNSNTIAAYGKMGFVKTGEICVDIGQGYKMDDFTMELMLD